eukprot:6194050-Pleurochrysis_carterae.AAC.1
MGAELPYNPWLQPFASYFALLATMGLGVALLAFCELPPTRIAAVLASAAAASSIICTSIVPPPPRVVVNGRHPTRFLSDVFPLSLLTHELGHMLLMEDHYQVSRNATGKVVTTEQPG